MFKKLFLPVVLTLSLVLTGCSGTKQTTSNDTKNTPSQPVKVKLTSGTNVLPYSAVKIAEALGYFKDEGIDLELLEMDGPKALQALASGDVDFSYTPADSIARASAANVPIITVASGLDALSMNFTIRKDVADKKGITPESPLNQKIQAFKGLKLGVTGPGAAGDIYTRLILKQNGVDPEKDVKLVSVGSAGGLLAALQQGQIDAYLLSPPSPETTESEGYGETIITTATEIEQLNNFIFVGLATSKSYAQKNPDVVKKVVRAVTKGSTFFKNQPPEKVAEVLKPFWSKVPADVMARSVKHIQPSLNADGKMSEEKWKKLINLLTETGQFKDKFDTKEGVNWTNQYLN